MSPRTSARRCARKPGTEVFFAGLSNSLPRYPVDKIEAAKTPETRQRRIDRAVARFATGKSR
jgi:uncharacterized protein YdeI (YjbR/CyaY-like superfamily)